MAGQFALPADHSSVDQCSLAITQYLIVSRIRNVKWTKKQEEAVDIADFKAVKDQE